MKSFHHNWGRRRKPGGGRGGNSATSKGCRRGGEAKGRAGQGLGHGGPRLVLLSLPRPGHRRHEGPPAEMTVLAPAWSPTSDYLLQDYPVTVPSNLQDVSHVGRDLGWRWGPQTQDAPPRRVDNLALPSPNPGIRVPGPSSLRPRNPGPAPPPSGPAPPPSGPAAPAQPLLPQTRGFSPLGGALRGPLAAGPGTALDGAAQDCGWVQDARLAGAREHGDTLCHQMCLSGEDTEAHRGESPARGCIAGTQRKWARGWSLPWAQYPSHSLPRMEATPERSTGPTYPTLYKALVPMKLYINHPFLPALAKSVCGWV
nr:fms-related tyrosine kinase 3 ligand isoform X8 [Macaca fascicularis]